MKPLCSTDQSNVSAHRTGARYLAHKSTAGNSIQNEEGYGVESSSSSGLLRPFISSRSLTLLIFAGGLRCWSPFDLLLLPATYSDLSGR